MLNGKIPFVSVNKAYGGKYKKTKVYWNIEHYKNEEIYID